MRLICRGIVHVFAGNSPRPTTDDEREFGQVGVAREDEATVLSRVERAVDFVVVSFYDRPREAKQGRAGIGNGVDSSGDDRALANGIASRGEFPTPVRIVNVDIRDMASVFAPISKAEVECFEI